MVRAVAKRTLARLVWNTPVDTGRARSNWRVGIGQPTRSVIEPYSPGSKLGRGETGNASAAISVGNARINAAGGGPGRFGVAIYVTNNVPYIEALNLGRSKQNNPGWIEASIAEGLAILPQMRIFGGGYSEGDE